MDPFYIALSLYRKGSFTECARKCTEILQADSQQQAVWVLKLRALTQRVAYDDTDVLESLADATLADNQWTCTAPPGTSRTATTKTPHRESTFATTRPQTQSRPASGVVRLNRSGLGGSQAGNGPQTAKTRAQTGRLLSRLGTASISTEDETFIVNTARLNIAQYANLPHLAKPLFEYLYFSQGNVKDGLQLAREAQKSCHNASDNFYWKCAITRCLIRLGLVRQSIETSTGEWYTLMDTSDGVLLVAKSYLIVDQPLAALEIYKKGLDKFPKDTAILSSIARVYEELRDPGNSVTIYKELLTYDSSNTEAIACVAAEFFYTGQPELALVLYKRLLQMGIHSAEVFCNIALCCLKTQQYDVIVPCIENALAIAKDELVAEVWYNSGFLGLAVGNLELAELCWKLARLINPSHSEACNNLGALALMSGRINEGQALLVAALSLDSELIEAKSNLEKLSRQNSEPVECLI